jgi:biopolymer transport protein ExbD
MKFKSQNRSSQMPEVNLIPMMDVIMTILTFFIIVSMTLTNSSGSIKVQLPGSGQGSNPSNDKKVEPQVIKIDAQGKLYLIQAGEPETPITIEQIEPQVKTYLQQNAKGVVLINADRTLPYDNVIQILMKLKTVGGDRVSLGVR